MNHFAICAGGMSPAKKAETVAKEVEDPTKSYWNWGTILHDSCIYIPGQAEGNPGTSLWLRSMHAFWHSSLLEF